jgi:hypothetical protein
MPERMPFKMEKMKDDHRPLSRLIDVAEKGTDPVLTLSLGTESPERNKFDREHRSSDRSLQSSK